MQSIIPGNYKKSPKIFKNPRCWILGKKSPKIPVFFGDIPGDIPSPESPNIPETGTNPRKWQL